MRRYTDMAQHVKDSRVLIRPWSKQMEEKTLINSLLLMAIRYIDSDRVFIAAEYLVHPCNTLHKT